MQSELFSRFDIQLICEWFIPTLSIINVIFNRACFSRCWPLRQAADLILTIFFVAMLAHYLVLAAAKCAWLLLLFNLTWGRLSRRVAIWRVRRTRHFSFLGAVPLAWPWVWKCRRRQGLHRQSFTGGRLMAGVSESVCSCLWTVSRSPFPLFGTELLLRPLPHCKKKWN